MTDCARSQVSYASLSTFVVPEKKYRCTWGLGQPGPTRHRRTTFGGLIPADTILVMMGDNMAIAAPIRSQFNVDFIYSDTDAD